MIRITKGIVAQVLVAVCIMMQVVIMLPHHHHEGSNVPCVNVFHCETDRCNHKQNMCGCEKHHCAAQTSDGETHSHDTEDSCILSRTDMIRLERGRLTAPVIVDVQLFVAQAVHVCPIHDADAVNCLNTITQLDRKRLRTQIPLYTSYVIAAIPPRAPSFTV